jgi:hypothetical protein
LKSSKLRSFGLGLAAALVLSTMTATSAGGSDDERGRIVRWDLVQVTQGVVLAGGIDVASDMPSGDKVSLTGSGQAEPPRSDDHEDDHDKGRANGGGTFVHKHANGTEVAHGVYFVTGFVSWRPAGGSLARALTDGVGEIDETTSGILTMNVHIVPDGHPALDGVLSVHCDLPGATFPIKEGVSLTVGPFHFVQVEHDGFTLLHILD